MKEKRLKKKRQVPVRSENNENYFHEKLQVLKVYVMQQLFQDAVVLLLRQAEG